MTCGARQRLSTEYNSVWTFSIRRRPVVNSLMLAGRTHRRGSSRHRDERCSPIRHIAVVACARVSSECPQCLSTDRVEEQPPVVDARFYWFQCHKCGHIWNVRIRSPHTPVGYQRRAVSSGKISY